MRSKARWEIVVCVCSLALGLLCGSASANVIMQLDETFASGATFSGEVTFSDAFDAILAVDGTLLNSSFGPSPDSINWVWWGFSSPRGSGIFSDFLMDGTSPSFTQFIELDWNNTSGIPVLDNSLGSANPDSQFANAINYNDPMVSYSFSPVSAVPEPSTLLLFGAGLAGVGFLRRKMR